MSIHHHSGLECESRRSTNIWSKRQVWPWSTKWSRAKANRFCQENTLVIANTLFQQQKGRLYTWTSPDGQHQNQIGYILCSWTWRSSIQLAKTRPGADSGTDHELLIAKYRLKLIKYRDHGIWSHYFMGNRWGNSGKCQTLFFWASKSLQMVTAAMKLKDAYSLEEKLWPT